MIAKSVHPRRRVIGWAAALGVGAVAAASPVAFRGEAGPSPGPKPGHRPVTRVYYIAADTVTWDYARQCRNLVTGKPFTAMEERLVSQGGNLLGSVFEKAIYRQYTDKTFRKLVCRPKHEEYMGLLGPVIRAEVGDTIQVVFRNNTPFPASIHPHGVFYTKENEGAPGNNGSWGNDRLDRPVEPGETYVYTWPVPERAGPGPDDPSSVGWLYHDHSMDMGVPGMHAGMVGPIVISRRGQARADGSPAGVDREVFALFNEFDEGLSSYRERNIERFGDEDLDASSEAFWSALRKPSVNGYMFANGPEGTTDTHPALTIRKGELTRWYSLTLGERDVHSPHWHGNTVAVRGHRADVVSVLPATVVTADMRADDPGIWLFHCHVDRHMMNGMITRYQVV
ncbi:multicopper oxidase domain-containing protein [Streptomyces orinoci]|uniref:Multicopper oxidase domain-containing protein n=1 Tax=Streptomyces orinoci TaxID=67339 RepID=A0ABV3JY90_STRON|nr:multicopper oxidase domain-containing protein [Streptomyces orinoci]